MIDYERLMSENSRAVKPSGIRKFFDIASEMEDIISLSIGEPDFKTPYSIRSVAIETLEKGKTWYTANRGLLALRREICAYLERRFSLSYRPEDQVLVTVGGSEAIDLFMRVLVNPGDEVLIVEPSFVSYAPLVEILGGVPVPISTCAEDDFRLTADALKAAITPKTKALVFPFPSNPTGAVMRKADLEEIAAVLRKTEIITLSDEIYAELTYGERHVSIASIDGMAERTVVINGFSKAYAMTGWRLGYAAGPAPLIEQMNKIHQYGIMSSPTISQYAAIDALKNGDEAVKNMVEEYNIRRRYITDALRRMGLSCFEPEGAFYCFPSVKSTGMTASEFCEKLLYEKRVAVVPGDAFGKSGEGFVRVSYANSLQNIMEAMKRIEAFLDESNKRQ